MTPRTMLFHAFYSRRELAIALGLLAYWGQPSAWSPPIAWWKTMAIVYGERWPLGRDACRATAKAIAEGRAS